MQVTETLSEGLKREFKVVVPRSELDSRLAARLEEMQGTAQIRGFRPGKVPIHHLRRLVGRQTMSEIVNTILKEQTDALLKERGERPALQPSYDLPEDQAQAERILDGKVDLQYALRYEVLPKIVLGDFKTIKIERPIVDVDQADVERQLLLLARNAATYATKTGPAADGDRVTIDYRGRIGDEPSAGGSDENAGIVLGSKQFIPGFEDQLLGAVAGGKLVVNVTFPDDYGAANLAGKAASFDVTVKDVAAPDHVAVDKALAEKLGLDSVEKLHDAVTRQLDAQNGPLVRQRVKRQLLDALDAMHRFDIPPTMVEQEFNAVWTGVLDQLERSGRTFADEGSTEEESRTYYRGIADRRVRLGLVLAEIGERNLIAVGDQELQRAIAAEIRMNPSREKEITAFYRSTPGALNRVRAPIFEEKVVDFLLELITVVDRPTTRRELVALAEAEEPVRPA